MFFTDDLNATQSVLFWLLGSLPGSSWPQVAPSVGVVVASAAALMAVTPGWTRSLSGRVTARTSIADVSNPRPRRFTSAYLIDLARWKTTALSGALRTVGAPEGDGLPRAGL
ncbi:iron complex transport system permease protein [Sinosporangium album]|uniref:Iron complex transport system permease protein n=1 Tax=Sinosporangium album TaxID=504805 RepID=A0A1G7SC60_9ACTN|nr:hypothetical protein [Sinosporangium album]SDG20492.1 iron complex transport system permease protein [Sinosporangium album]